jgi:hypothetical protein
MGVFLFQEVPIRHRYPIPDQPDALAVLDALVPCKALRRIPAVPGGKARVLVTVAPGDKLGCERLARAVLAIRAICMGQTCSYGKALTCEPRGLARSSVARCAESGGRLLANRQTYVDKVHARRWSR